MYKYIIVAVCGSVVKMYNTVGYSPYRLSKQLELYRARTPHLAVSMIREFHASSLLTTCTVVMIGVANKIKYLRHGWVLPNYSKHIEANFSRVICCTVESRDYIPHPPPLCMVC